MKGFGIKLVLVWRTVSKNEKRALGQTTERLKSADWEDVLWNSFEVLVQQNQVPQIFFSYTITVPIEVFVYESDNSEEAIGQALERVRVFVETYKVSIDEGDIRVETFIVPEFLE